MPTKSPKRRVTITKVVEPDVPEDDESSDELDLEREWLEADGELRLSVLTSDGWVHVGRVTAPTTLEELAARIAQTQLAKPGRASTIRIARDDRRSHYQRAILVPHLGDLEGHGNGQASELLALRFELQQLRAELSRAQQQPAGPSPLDYIDRIGAVLVRAQSRANPTTVSAGPSALEGLMAPVLTKLISRGMIAGQVEDDPIASAIKAAIESAPEIIAAFKAAPALPVTDAEIAEGEDKPLPQELTA